MPSLTEPCHICKKKLHPTLMHLVPYDSKSMEEVYVCQPCGQKHIGIQKLKAIKKAKGVK